MQFKKPTSYINMLSRAYNENNGENYQQDTVDLLIKELDDFLEFIRRGRNFDSKILLQAPTGSGKTIISGVLIDSIFENYQNTFSIIWICETPSLTEQSKVKIAKLSNGIVTKNYDEYTTSDKLEENSVVFINWEKLKNKNATESTEQSKSIFDLVSEAKSEGRIILVMIDEAHSHAGSKLSKDVLNKINPHITIEITATPTDEQESYQNKFEIDIEKVKDVGFVKQGVIINSDMRYGKNERAKYDVSTYREMLIVKSLEKKSDIKDSLSKFLSKSSEDIKGSEYENGFNPLLVIQLPNNNEAIINDVKNILSKRGITIDNGKLAVYMHGDYTDELDNIGKDENVDVLLFKQAIAKGWDCPRASVITFLRDPKSKALTTQTIGRILRMPYLKKYPIEFDSLNYGYVYIEDANNDIIRQAKEQIVEQGDTLLTEIRTEFADKIGNLNKLLKFSLNENPEVINENKSFLYKSVRKELKLLDIKKITDFSITKLNKKVLGESVIDSGNILGKSDGIELVQDEVTDYTYEDLIQMYNNRLDLLSKDVHSVNNSDIFDIFTKKVRTQISSMFTEIMEYDALEEKTLTVVLNNFDNYLKEIERLRLLISSTINRKTVFEKFYNVPFSMRISNSADNIAFNKLLYNDNYAKYNKLELELAKFLDINANTIFWYKNGDSGREHLSLAYRLNQKDYLFYPDFIAETEEFIYILETKGMLGNDDSIKKAEELSKYPVKLKYTDIELSDGSKVRSNIEKPIKVGFVKIDSEGNLKIFVGENYMYEYGDDFRWNNIDSEYK